MKTFLVRRVGPWVLAVAGVLAVAAPSAGAAAASNQELPASALVGDPSIDPCNGQAVVFTGTVHVLFNYSHSDTSVIPGFSHVNSQDVQGVDAAGNKYQLTVTFNAMTPTDTNGATTYAGEEHVAVISDGATPNYQVQGVVHETVNANGDVTAFHVSDLTPTCTG